MKHIAVALICACTLPLFAADARRSEFALPAMPEAPVIDGKVAPGEWFGAGEYFGMIRHNSDYLAHRQGSFLIGYDAENLYLACRSELPDDPVKLLQRVRKRDGMVYNDDNVEFVIQPPGGKFVYQLIANPRGATFDVRYPVVNGGTTHTDQQPWDPACTVKSGIDGKNWTLEIKLPLASLDVKAPPQAGAVWRIQAARSWTSPREQCALNRAVFFSAPDEMPRFTVAPDAVAVKLETLGAGYAAGKHNISFTLDNPSARPVKVKYAVEVVSDAAPRQQDSEIEIAPGKSGRVTLAYDEAARIVRNFGANFTQDGKTLFERSFRWEPVPDKRWLSPADKRGSELEIGVYPYFKKVRARFGNAAEPAADLYRSARFSLKRVDGTACGTPVEATRGKNGFAAELPFDAAPGNYLLTAELTSADGKIVTKEQKFEVAKFPWEHNSIGDERVIVPPFKPLTYPAERRIDATLTGFSLRDGFFDRISADGDANILAAPVTMSVNGKILRESTFRLTEQSPDRAISEETLQVPGLTVDLKRTIEYDGFCRMAFTFRPAETFKAERAFVEIPVRGDVAEFFHTVHNVMKYNPADRIPAGEGTVWKSSDGRLNTSVAGNFRPYLWVGGVRKGVSWFAESDRHWSLDRSKPALELIRRDGSVVIRVNLVNRPALWTKPFTIEMGMQPTPVKPQPEGKRRMLERFRAPGGLTLSTLAGGACWSTVNYDWTPVENDYDFVRELANKSRDAKAGQPTVERFMERYFNKLPENERDFFRRHLERGLNYASFSELLIPYTNSRASDLRWPEYRTYMDEWWCADYRANNADDYNNTPTRSYQDMVLYQTRRLVREGLDGIYFDNVRDWTNPNPVTGPAYELEDGSMQPYFDLFAMRELVKRTATMLYLEKKTFLDGRPLLTLHMTNTNVVPIVSFGSISLDLEANFGSRDFQDRFSEGYLKTCTLGGQTGLVPEILIQITGSNRDFVTRTFLAVTLAYDLPFVMNGGGLSGDWAKLWKTLYAFGYGSPDVEVIPSYQSNPVSVDWATARVTLYRKRDAKEAMIAVSDFDGNGSPVTLELGKLGFPVKSATDAETGKTLPLDGERLHLDLPRNDFRLISVH